MSDRKNILKIRREIRLEAAKASLLHSAIEAIIVSIIVFYLLSSFSFSFTIYEYSFSSEVLFDVMTLSAIFSSFFFIFNFIFSFLRRDIRKFETYNSEVNEMLRTAIQSANSKREDKMASALYSDTIDTIKSTSPGGFVNKGRLLFSFYFFFGIIVFIAILASGVFGGVSPEYFISESGNPIFNSGGSGSPDTSSGGASPNSSEVLGEKGEVSRGDDSNDILVDESGSGSSGSDYSGGGSESEGSYPSFDSEVEGVQTEIAPSEEFDDPELIKEYNLRIRDSE